jgi:hypothetical protein
MAPGGHVDDESGSYLAKPLTHTHSLDRVTELIDIDRLQLFFMIMSQR